LLRVRERETFVANISEAPLAYGPAAGLCWLHVMRMLIHVACWFFGCLEEEAEDIQTMSSRSGMRAWACCTSECSDLSMLRLLRTAAACVWQSGLSLYQASEDSVIRGQQVPASWSISASSLPRTMACANHAPVFWTKHASQPASGIVKHSA
jgi:hypothetical protein